MNDVPQRGPAVFIDNLIDIPFLSATDHNSESFAAAKRIYDRMTENRLTLDTDTQVFFYEQDHYYLSNFSSFQIVYKDQIFPTVEHAYHWMKFQSDIGYAGDVPIQDNILDANSAHRAFQIAQNQKQHRNPQWDAIKFDVMRHLLILKIRQHEYVRTKLLQTSDRELIENSWRDAVWGWGPQRDGQNLLGTLWMQLRDELNVGTLR